MNAPVDCSHLILETPRLRLRPWRMEDLADFNRYASVDGVGQMAGWSPHRSMQESRKILQKNCFKLFICQPLKTIRWTKRCREHIAVIITGSATLLTSLVVLPILLTPQPLRVHIQRKQKPRLHTCVNHS